MFGYEFTRIFTYAFVHIFMLHSKILRLYSSELATFRVRKQVSLHSLFACLSIYIFFSFLFLSLPFLLISIRYVARSSLYRRASTNITSYFWPLVWSSVVWIDFSHLFTHKSTTEPHLSHIAKSFFHLTMHLYHYRFYNPCILDNSLSSNHFFFIHSFFRNSLKVLSPSSSTSLTAS
jgi:hypothetical protein